MADDSNTDRATTVSASLPGHDELPSNWFFLAVSILWAIFSFAFGFEAVVNFDGWLIEGKTWVGAVSLIDLVGCLFTASLALILWKRKEWLPKKFAETSADAATNAYVWFGVLGLTVIVSLLPRVVIRETTDIQPSAPLTQTDPLNIDWNNAKIEGWLPGEDVVRIGDISVPAQNVSKYEINIQDAYIISGIDGMKTNMVISPPGIGGEIPVNDLAPVPPNAKLIFQVSFPRGLPDSRGNFGMKETEFMQRWGIFSVVIKYDGKEFRKDFDRTFIATQLREFHPDDPNLLPHVSRRK